jgi:hypothetical protein
MPELAPVTTATWSSSAEVDGNASAGDAGGCRAGEERERGGDFGHLDEARRRMIFDHRRDHLALGQAVQ